MSKLYMSELGEKIRKRQDNVLAIIMMITAVLSIGPQYVLTNEVILAVYALVLIFTGTAFLIITIYSMVAIFSTDIRRSVALIHCITGSQSYFTPSVLISNISEYIIRYRFRYREPYFYLKWILMLILFGSAVSYGAYPILPCFIVGLVIHEVLKRLLFEELISIYTMVAPLGHSKRLEASIIHERYTTGGVPVGLWKAYILL